MPMPQSESVTGPPGWDLFSIPAHAPHSPAAKHRLHLWWLSEGKFPAPALHSCSVSGALGSQGLMAFASALPLESSRSLSVYFGRKESFLFLLPRGKQVLLLLCLWEQEGLLPLSHKRKALLPLRGVFRQQQDFMPVPQQQPVTPSQVCHQGDSLVCRLPQWALGGGRPAQNCLKVSADSCCVWVPGYPGQRG